MSLTPRLDKLQKNYIINGDMRIAQRATSFAAIANGSYGLDRFRYGKSGAMVHTLSQDTDVPTLVQSGYLFQNSLRLNLTTPDTAIAATDQCFIQQPIEGYNFAKIAQKDFTISFWVKATLTGTYTLSLQNSGADRHYITEYTINASNTWEKKTINIPASISSGTWNYTSGVGLYVQWILAGGTNFQSTTNTWGTGNLYVSPNQVNGVNTGATDFRITGVMVIEGTHDDPAFTGHAMTVNDELIACQRYFCKSMPYATPAANNTGVRNGSVVHLATVTGPITFQFTVSFPVRMRATANITFYGIHQNNSNFSNFTASNDGGTTASLNAGAGDAYFTFGNSGAFNTSGPLMGIHWSADAEL